MQLEGARAESTKRLTRGNWVERAGGGGGLGGVTSRLGVRLTFKKVVGAMRRASMVAKRE